MSAVSKNRSVTIKRVFREARSVDPLSLIHGSLSTKKVSRQFPLLATFHKVSDGALLGALVAVGIMSTLALHWQHLWAVAFSNLETTRELSHRVMDSTSMIEQHLLQKADLPLSMVPTKAANLLYLDRPDPKSSVNQNYIIKNLVLFKDIKTHPIHYGY